MLFVMTANVVVYQNISVIHTEVVGQNVYLIAIVPKIRHAFAINVLIHVLEFAVKMPNVRFIITFQFVIVSKIIMEMHLVYAEK